MVELPTNCPVVPKYATAKYTLPPMVIVASPWLGATGCNWMDLYMYPSNCCTSKLELVRNTK